MKKFLSLLTSFILLLTTSTLLASCKKKTQAEAEVSLLNVSAETVQETPKQVLSMKYFDEQSISESISEEEQESSSQEEQESQSEGESNDQEIFPNNPTYTFIFKSQTTISFTITLENKNNYYIFDFKLSCAEEEVQYWDATNEEWVGINDTWIRWNGSNNLKAKYLLRLPNAEITPDNIRITEMYYSDRADKSNKIAVNMNDRDVYTVYKMDDGMITTETVYNTREEYVFSMSQLEGVDVKSIYVNETPLEVSEDGNYHVQNDGLLTVVFEKPVGDVVYHGKYEKNIELFDMKIKDYSNGQCSISDNLCYFFISSKKGTGIDFQNIYFYIEEDKKICDPERFNSPDNQWRIPVSDMTPELFSLKVEYEGRIIGVFELKKRI
ncbi:MAG: hypothetical protein SOT34_00435 [Candidatus Borkfalkiaceae bacterium]|nr:hypothetical protein [Christensenellaceae bacterium]